MTHDAVSVTAMLLLAAFGVERISRGLLFLLESFKAWRTKFPDPASLKDQEVQDAAARRQKWASFTVCGLLSLILIYFGKDLRVLAAMGVQNQPVLDAMVTWLVLVAGCDRLKDILGDGPAAAPDESSGPPVQVAGTITLVPAGVEDDRELVADGGRGARTSTR
ncbi:hypothetical protein [Occallatibacter riparius]|uniref:Uncharacterized protein n=1 Tax=Occallatibacter riparius TaxID=1002689 RepID=A0A9J7BPR0_9BACT|nr:hypothetical protein [Occallatibacter riparius]UWZ84696.1 hypothetical protein MOP44_01885 [Occallatibacter riparius]